MADDPLARQSAVEEAVEAVEAEVKTSGRSTAEQRGGKFERRGRPR